MKQKKLNSEQKNSDLVEAIQLRIDFLQELYDCPKDLKAINSNYLIAQVYILGCIKENERWIKQFTGTIH